MLRLPTARPLHFTLGAALLCFTPAASAQIQDLGANDVNRFVLSATGEAATGQRSGAGGMREVFRWFDDGTIESLPTPTGVPGAPLAISDDGSVVCGRAIVPGGIKRVLRWDASGTAIDLSLPGTASALANDMSRDGQTVALNNWFPDGTRLAAIWTPSTGTVPILPPAGLVSTEVLALSDDGSTAFGRAFNPINLDQSYFRWSSATGPVAFPTPGNGGVAGVDLNADGSVLTGTTGGVLAISIFRWTAAGGYDVVPTPLERLVFTRISADGSIVYGTNLATFPAGPPGFFTWNSSGVLEVPLVTEQVTSTASTADGSVIVGTVGVQTSSPARGFRWSLATGFEGLDPFGGNASVTSMSLDGSVIAGMLDTSHGRRAVLWRTDGTIGDSYCGPGVPNSSGTPGEMSLGGSNVSEYGSLVLQASGLPQNTFGFFMVSNTEDFVVMPGGSQGNLCLGGAIGRFVGPGQMGNSGTTGTLSLEIDPQSLPSPNGPVVPSFGEQWFFQAWHRDTNPASTSNFTDGVTVRLF